MAIRAAIEAGRVMDINFNGQDSSNGWKLSIAGKSVSDAECIFNAISDFCFNNNIAFKIATVRRLNHPNTEQGRKAATVYVPNNMAHLELAETIYSLLSEYKGWHDVKTPNGYEHYAGAVFMRNDRNEYGEYIPAKKSA